MGEACRKPGRSWGITASASGFLLLSAPAQAATFEICRTLGSADLMAALVVPSGSLYRDNGRADDPLAAFSGDRWQLRLETITDVVIPKLQPCVRVRVRITSDSSVKSVSLSDNRTFIYTGSSRLLDPPAVAEELLSTRGRVIDQVP